MLEGVTLDLSQDTLNDMLLAAVRDCDIDMFRLLVSQGAEPLAKRMHTKPPDYDDFDNEDDSYYDEPREMDSLLVVATTNGAADIVEQLLQMGAEVDYLGGGRLTAINAWVQSQKSTNPKCDQRRVGRLLLRAGADLDADGRGRRAYWKSTRQIARTQNSWAHDVIVQHEAEQSRIQLDMQIPEAQTMAGGAGRL
jgi:hypothetical protein